MTAAWMGLGGWALKCATNEAARAGSADGGTRASSSGAHRAMRPASTAATRRREASIAAVIGHVASSQSAPFHTAEKTGDERSVHSAPARYAAGAVRPADT